MKKLSIENTILGMLYMGKNDEAQGRRCVLANALLSTIISNIIGGVFYSGFLLCYGIDMVNIGIISFVPSIASLLSLLSPFILERFPRRKRILAIARMSYYAIVTVGVMVIPLVFTENSVRVWAITLAMIAANSINALFGNGYTAWHVNFMPDSIRGDFLLTQSCISVLVSGIFTVVISIITDSLAGSPKQLTIINILRVAAFFIAVWDVIVLCRPKEYPYEKTAEKPRLRDVFTLPLSNKKFCLTVLVGVMWTFSSNLTASVINTFLVGTPAEGGIGISYTLINGVNLTYFFFFLFCSKMWKKFIRNVGWFKAYAFSTLIQGSTHFLYAFITSENSIALFLIVRHMQHVMGIITNLCSGNLIYINLPESDRVSYISFYTVINSGVAFVSQMLGTWFVSFMDGRGVEMVGHVFTAVPLLLIFTAVTGIITGVTTYLLTPKLNPKIDGV